MQDYSIEYSRTTDARTNAHIRKPEPDQPKLLLYSALASTTGSYRVRVDLVPLQVLFCVSVSVCVCLRVSVCICVRVVRAYVCMRVCACVRVSVSARVQKYYSIFPHALKSACNNMYLYM